LSDSELQEVFKRAAAIAKVVPESMQEAAFHRALDALTGQPSRTMPDRSRRAAPARKRTERKEEGEEEDPVAMLMAMERSRAPEVDDNEGSLGKGLALLHVARREFGIDGLTSQQIATVLTDKFRSRLTRQAINQAMDAAGRMVDRVKTGRGTKIRIMEAGEHWLELPPEKRRSDGGKRVKGASSPRRTRRLSHAEKEGPGESPAPSKPAPRRPSRGPKGAVESLINAGWFSTPRSLPDIRKELESRFALRYKPTDLSPAMTRLLREGKLRRTKSESGQYDYES
jgi:hypothetical protein